MKLLELKVMKGPNYWSNYRHCLIVMKLDIEELEFSPTNTINGFYDRLKNLLPSLYKHRCSEQHEGGFFERVEEGTWMGHVIEHIALELQTLAGMSVGFGRTRSASQEGVYHVIFAYEIEKAGLFAAEAAVRVAQYLVSGETYDVNADIEALKKIRSRYGIGPSTHSLISEAKSRKIPYRHIKNSVVVFGHGIHQKKIQATISSGTSHLGVELACDKEATKEILSKAHLPIPQGGTAYNKDELNELIEEFGFPLVIKPIDGNHGRGVTTNINSHTGALEAFKLAQTISKEVIVERFIQGADFRFLVINYKLVAVAKRTPALIMGDGTSTIMQLIEKTNSDPRRGACHEKNLTTIIIDEITTKILEAKHFTVDSVLPIGEILYLKDTANLSTGGTSTDVTDIVHPQNILMAERAARVIGLDICGIDVVANSISDPISLKNGAIIEVNACPGLRMHLCPSSGSPRNVAAPIMDMLFPDKTPSRIPIIAITGTNGKTTTTRLIAHFAKHAGHKVGYTTTDGIYVDNQQIFKGDCTGRQSAETILSDPGVDFAVLECARGGILRSGLGFDRCNISIITNISADHLGLGSIDSEDEMLRVKSVVAFSTFDDGYAILNADDDRVYDLKYDLDCHVALFSIEENSERINRHCEKGGFAAIIENGYLTICEGRWRTRIMLINNIPLSFGGKASAMIKNLLPAALAAYLQKFSVDVIRKGLSSFIPSPELTPGRMNIFHFKNADLLVDYAHNPGGFEELKSFMSKVESPCKIGIITAVGDRRDQDIEEVGKLSAQIFDEIIIRLDRDMRGRTGEEITALLVKGITSVEPAKPIAVIPVQNEAIKYALDIAKPGSFIAVFAESVQPTLDFVKELKEKEQVLLLPQYVYSKAS